MASKGASGIGTVSQDGDGILMSAIDKVEDIPSEGEARADALFVLVACSSHMSQTCDGLGMFPRMV